VQATREAVRRPSDNELVGFVALDDDGQWRAATTFDVVLRSFDNRRAAVEFLQSHGLAVLAQRWSMWSTDEQRWRAVTLVEAGVGWVRVRAGLDPRSGDVRTLRGEDLTLLRAPEVRA
jgi:hypothetical protein